VAARSLPRPVLVPSPRLLAGGVREPSSLTSPSGSQTSCLACRTGDEVSFLFFSLAVGQRENRTGPASAASVNRDGVADRQLVLKVVLFSFPRACLAFGARYGALQAIEHDYEDPRPVRVLIG